MDSDRLFYSRLFLATFIKPRPLDKVPPVPDFLDKPDWNTALGEACRKKFQPSLSMRS
jgi:NADPH-dependent 2,4-dienoyl-CoA reductase/sulfur reductase-like enzyme